MGEIALFVAILAVLVLDIIGIIHSGIEFGHPFLVPLGAIIAFVILGFIKAEALIVVLFIIAVITIVYLFEKVKEREVQIVQRNSDLLDAAVRGDLQAAQKLIKKGANVNCVVSYDGKRTVPLQLAAEKGYKDMVLLLVEKGADVNLYFDGKPPLDSTEDDEIKTILMNRGAKSQSEFEEALRKANDYYVGYGVAQDYKKAVEWYTKAMNLGCGCAKVKLNLAICYANGHGVEEDIERAIDLCKDLAEQGYAHAQCLLGGCYENREGFKQSFKKAVKWYTKSAEQGFALAQDALGDCYRYGKGVELNPNRAEFWYKKAAEQGNPDAQNSLNELRRDFPFLE